MGELGKMNNNSSSYKPYHFKKMIEDDIGAGNVESIELVIESVPAFFIDFNEG